MSKGIGVIPNAGEVHAIVKRKWKDRRKNVAYVKLQIVTAKDYGGMPNFVKGEIGKDINIAVSKDDLEFFKGNVNVLISMVGDEKQQFYTARMKPRENR